MKIPASKLRQGDVISWRFDPETGTDARVYVHVVSEKNGYIHIWNEYSSETIFNPDYEVTLEQVVLDTSSEPVVHSVSEEQGTYEGQASAPVGD